MRRPAAALAVAYVAVACAAGTGGASRPHGGDMATASEARSAAARQRPRPLQLRERCVTRADRRGVVRFAAADRTRLIGVMLGSGARGVVLAHGSGEDLCAWIPYARRLAAAGFRVLALDHRRHGSSQWPTAVARLWRVDLDVAAAAGALRRRGARSVVLVGSSMGATASIAAAPLVAPPVAGVVSLSATDVFVTVNAVAAARRLTVPLLVVATEGDADFADRARALAAAAASAEKRLEILPGTVHGLAMLRDTDVERLVLQWIAAHSGG